MAISQPYTVPSVVPVVTDSNRLVVEGWDKSTAYASAAFSEAKAFLSTIANVGNNLANIPNLDYNFGAITAPVDPFNMPVKPTEPDLTTHFPTFGASLTLTPVGELIIPEQPVFDAVAPTLRNIVAPAPFSDSAPLFGGISNRRYTERPLDTAPNLGFEWIEQDYASSLLSEVQSRLQLFVSGFSTGLTPAVEQQIWDRARSRVSAATRRLKAQNLRFWSASGWDQPGGDVTNKNFEAEVEAINQDNSASREIAVAQANLEQSNMHFAFTTAAQIEGIVIQHTDLMMQRALDASKYAIEAAKQLYLLKLQEFEDKTKANDAQDELQLKQLAELIQVFETKVKVKQIEFENYKIDNEVELTKNEIYKARVSAYTDQVNAMKAIGDLRAIKLNADIKTGQEIPLEAYKTQAEVMKVMVGAESDRLKSLVDTLQARTTIFTSETQAETSRIEGQVKVQEQQVKLLVAEASTHIEVLKANVSTMLAKLEMLIEAAKAGAGTASQLAAAALSSVNLSAGIGSHESNSTSNSFSSSISTSTTHSD